MRPLKFCKTEESVCFVALHYQPGRFDSRKTWAQVGKRLGIAPRRRSFPLLRRAAAVAVGIILITAGILYLTTEGGDTFIAKQDRTQFTLPDDSRIEMQKGAILAYDKHFDKDERRVTIQGEIAFAVARDEAKPFIVSTPAAQIEVLGTEFTVRADDDETRLSVASGIVRFTPYDPVIPLLCTAGMTVYYNAEPGIINVSSPGSEMEINSKTRSFTFNNMGLGEIVMVLSRFYNVQIELPDSESHLTFSSSFTKGSINEIINIINFTLDTHITIIPPR
ncbi:MAG: FecR domain-containing protein [Proteiniphilum sp.]|nr:FecR domain-containing protein [Proteiniphilum sp.]